LACEGRLQHVSNGNAFAPFEKSDRARDRCWAEVQVALRRADLLKPGEILDSPNRGAPYRQMTTERMMQHVHADLPKSSLPV